MKLKQIFALALLTSLMGCSFGPQRSTAPKRELETSPARTRFDSMPDTPSKGKEGETLSDIVITWAGSKDGIDGYLLDYGYSPESLPWQKRIPLSDIQLVEDPEYGTAFTTILPGVANDRSLYVVIRAYKADKVSAPSAPIEVAP